MRQFRLLLVLALVCTSTGARAESSDDALVEKGLQLRRERKDTEALTLFRQAYDARPAPRTQAQIALAEQALGNWVDAERDLLIALAAVDDPWISSHRETLNKALDAIRKHLGTLAVEANVPDAEIRLNDKPVGKLPMGALRVEIGTIRLELRAKGYEPAARTIDIAPGATSTERFELRADAEPAPVLPSTAPASPPPAERKLTLTPIDSPPTGAAPTRGAFAWGTLGAAGAFLGGAIAAQVMREQNASRYNDDSRCLFGALSRDERCGAYRGQAESAQDLANIGYVAAGALGVASAILFWSSAPAPKTSGVNLSLNVGSTGGELTVRGKL